MSLSSLAGVSAETLDTTLGAVFLGVVFSCMLFGVSSLQVYLYYHHYPNDRLLYKSSVGLLWILDALHTALVIFSAFYYGVTSFGDVAKLGVVIWSMKLANVVQVVIILIVQSMYTYRLWLLSGYHHSVLRYVVTAIVLGGLAIGIVLAYETYALTSFADLSQISWAIEASFSASTAIDILISAAMCFYLRKSKSQVHAEASGQPVLNSRISGLIQYTLSCGLFTSACSLACLFTFIAMPHNLIFLALTYILTHLYVNSFVAMMNARRRQVRTPASVGAGVVSFALETRGGTVQTQTQPWPGNPPTTTVTISTEVHGDLENQHRSRVEKAPLDVLDWDHQTDEDGTPTYARHW